MNVKEKIDADAYQTTLIRPETSLRYTDRARYFDELRARNADRTRLERQVFKSDLAEEHGLVGHPKLDKLFQLSWDFSHSEGLCAVADTFEELMELVK